MVMLTDTTAVRTYFAKLGLEREIADIYLSLHAHGPQTISELSRNAHVERTRIYRLIDKLLESDLIEVEPHNKRGVIKAAPIANLHILISQKEQELRSLQDELGLIEQVLARNSLSSPAARIQFYEGPEGVRQMLWNQTKAKTEITSILYEDMQNKVDSKSFERWAEKCNEQQIQHRSIYGDRFIKAQKDWDDKRLRYWQRRYIAPDIFPIAHDTIIYDDVVTYHNWKSGEVFGMEIYNRDIASAQRAFFEMLWQQAQPKAKV